MRITLGQLTDADSPLLLPSRPVHQEPDRTAVTGKRCRQANPIETRRRLVDAEAQRLEVLGATVVRVLCEDGVDHYGVAMRDPEGNEFDIN
jgi:Glyoxalase-like domain